MTVFCDVKLHTLYFFGMDDLNVNLGKYVNIFPTSYSWITVMTRAVLADQNSLSPSTSSLPGAHRATILDQMI